MQDYFFAANLQSPPATNTAKSGIQKCNHEKKNAFSEVKIVIINKNKRLNLF